MEAVRARASATLWTPRRFERQIEHLHARHVLTPRLYELAQDGVTFASVARHKRAFSRLLARTVTSGEYSLAPARIRQIQIDDKTRKVFSLRLTDLILHGAIADFVQDAMAPGLSYGLYSYREGRSWWTAVAAFSRYVRAHRRERPDPRQRGLYVLRRDVDAYTDSIPVGDGSPLWRILRETLSAVEPITDEDWRVIVHTVRPEAFEVPGRVFVQWRGVPTGLPIACILFNLYLSQLDRELDSIPGAFYARYSDDILFAHPSAEVARAASATIDRVLGELRLCLNPDKRRDLYLTAAGRRSADWPDAGPAMAVPLLGCRVSAHGQVSLNRKKIRRLLRDLRVRAVRTAASSNGDPAAKGRLVCAAINRALRRRGDPLASDPADLLRRVVTDRTQLRQLDYWIARIVLGVVSRWPGARAFRELPYRRFRREWRLDSLVRSRNRIGRGDSR
jgi:hypothetical protein